MHPIYLYQKSINNRLSAKELDTVRSWMKDYPYFSILHFLEAKFSGTKEGLFRAAIYANNRVLLKKYVDGSLIISTHNELDMEIQRAGNHSHVENALFAVIDFNEHIPVTSSKDIPFQIIEESKENIDVYLSWDIQYRTYLYISQGHKLDFYPLPPLGNPAQTNQNEVAPSIPITQQQAILDAFLQKTPGMPPPVLTIEEDGPSGEDEFVSETLARLHIRQNNYQEAIRMFKKLSLKFPEKRTYFESQIKALS